MLHHVLVPLDGSKLAEKSIGPAKHILREHGHITLATVIQAPKPPVYAYPSADVVHEIQEDSEYMTRAVPQAQHYLESIARNLRVNGYKVNIEILSGDPASAIIELAEKIHPDVIVMSTHGRSGLSRFLFGSVTTKVLSTTAYPVLVIPNRQQAAETTKQSSSSSRHSPA